MHGWTFCKWKSSEQGQGETGIPCSSPPAEEAVAVEEGGPEHHKPCKYSSVSNMYNEKRNNSYLVCDIFD